MPPISAMLTKRVVSGLLIIAGGSLLSSFIGLALR